MRAVNLGNMREVTLLVSEHISDEKAQYELDRAVSNNWISLWWHISDVQECAGDAPMGDDDAREILEEMHYRHDANNGVTWDTIHHYVDMWREHQEEDNG